MATGTVKKRGETWTIIYREPPDEDGNRRQRWKGGYRTEREAQRALRQVLTAQDEHRYVRPERLTFKQLCEKYLPAIEGTRRASTIEVYQRTLALYVYPAVGGVRVQDLSPDRLDRLYRSLATERKTDDGRKLKALKPATIQLVHAIVGGALKWARRHRIVAVNVAELADVPSIPAKQVEAWPAEFVHCFIAHTKDERLGAMWRFLALTGCRRGEAAGLRWALVDLDAGAARIEQQLVQLATGLTLAPPKSAAGVRTIPLDPGTVQALRDLQAAQDVERALWGDAYQDGGFVFAHEDGRPLSPSSLSQMFQVRRKAAGLPPLHLHGLRHSAASAMALKLNVGRETLAKALGHASARTASAYYVHADSADVGAAVTGWAEAVGNVAR